MLTWETDLNRIFGSEQWAIALRYNYTASHCINHWELTQKILAQWIGHHANLPKCSLTIHHFAGETVATLAQSYTSIGTVFSIIAHTGILLPPE